MEKSSNKKPIPYNIRRSVFTRDSYRCRYCGTRGEDIVLHVDHVYPESRGGETTIDNLVTACMSCNLSKRSKIGMWPNPIGYFDEQDRQKVPEVPVLIYGLITVCVGLILVSIWASNIGVVDAESVDSIHVLAGILLALTIGAEWSWSRIKDRQGDKR